MKLEIASLSDIGKVRQNNEDALGYFEPSGTKEKVINRIRLRRPIARSTLRTARCGSE